MAFRTQALLLLSEHDVSVAVVYHETEIAPPLICRHIMLRTAERNDPGRLVKKPSAAQHSNGGLLHPSTVAAE